MDLREYRRKYYEANKEKLQAYQRWYYHKRRQKTYIPQPRKPKVFHMKVTKGSFIIHFD